MTRKELVFTIICCLGVVVIVLLSNTSLNTSHGQILGLSGIEEGLKEDQLLREKAVKMKNFTQVKLFSGVFRERENEMNLWLKKNEGRGVEIIDIKGVDSWTMVVYKKTQRVKNKNPR